MSGVWLGRVSEPVLSERKWENSMLDSAESPAVVVQHLCLPLLLSYGSHTVLCEPQAASRVWAGATR